MSYLGNEPRFSQFPSKFFDGDGTAMTVSLDYAPPNEASLLVFISGVRQDTSAYNLSGTSLTFTGTVPSGTANVQVVHLGQLVGGGVPADDSISTAKIADDAVTSAKIATGAVGSSEIATDAVDSAEIAANAVGNAEMADDAVGIAELSATGTASATTYLRGDNAWGAISEYNDAAVLNDIATLALHSAVQNNQAAYNLSNAFIDQYEDSSGLDVLTDTFRNSGEYMTSVDSGILQTTMALDAGAYNSTITSTAGTNQMAIHSGSCLLYTSPSPRD